VKNKKRLSKLSKQEILDLPLTSFGIRPLTLWVERPSKLADRLRAKIIRRSQDSGSDKDVAVELLQSELLDIQKMVKAHPNTVERLRVAHPYRLDIKLGNYRNGLGKRPIAELKAKLLDMGLTADDWSALVPRNELLKHLSKKAIKQVPITQLFPLDDWGHGYYLKDYLDCSHEQLAERCLGDFLKVNPLAFNKAHSNRDAFEFLRRHKQKLTHIWQQLKSKGFTSRDGAFFKWNPSEKSFHKAR